MADELNPEEKPDVYASFMGEEAPLSGEETPPAGEEVPPGGEETPPASKAATQLLSVTENKEDETVTIVCGKDMFEKFAARFFI